MPRVEQEMLTLPEHLVSPPVFMEVHVVSCHFVFLYFLPVMSCPLVIEFVIFLLISRAGCICSSTMGNYSPHLAVTVNSHL